MVEIVNISTSGGALSQQFVEALRGGGAQQPGTEPASFALPGRAAPTARELEVQTAAAWKLLPERWDAVRANLGSMDLNAGRRWVLRLFDILDFNPTYHAANLRAGDLSFDIHYLAWADDDAAPPLHSVAPGQELDRREGVARGRRSPHDELQAYLNTQRAGWGIVTNGRVLRLLRTYHHVTTRGYVEFDLEGIFESRSYADFRALYRLAHASRFHPDGAGSTPLERLYDTSVAAGIAVGGDLRHNVKHAIETLANGLLTPELRTRLAGDEAATRDFFAEVLLVIYRVLFMLFAEQRGLLPGRATLYAQEYSASALRERAEAGFAPRDGNADLWRGLQVTFELLWHGAPALEVPAFNGMLFDPERTPTMRALECPNGALLSAMRSLTLVERGGVQQRISYIDLGVEELGSIYESLLDYAPRVAEADELFYADELGTKSRYEVQAGQFFLDPRGLSRKSSGSYYTNPHLVARLIDSALRPVAEAAIERAGPEPAARAQAILALKVCDPACGSGAFLIAATNYLGQVLAQVRAADEYPTEEEVRRARHDVLANCIYGVDLNPMAVQLAKVSLWIDAAVADQPLTFLDHHIRCGNSLIGATKRLLEEGIPDRAFEPVEGDDKEVAKQVRKRNAEERKSWDRGRGGISRPLERDGVVLIENLADLAVWQQMRDLAQSQPAVAERAYTAYRHTPEFERAKTELDLWTAAFFWPLTSAHGVPTEGMLRLFQASPKAVEPEFLEAVAQLADQQHFFHWELEFPQVFDRDDPGFDCLLGNPPWDRFKLEDHEFFAYRAPEISLAANAAARGRMIDTLRRANPQLHAAYRSALRRSEEVSRFLRRSARFPNGARGDLNSYLVFAELFGSLIRTSGRAGVIRAIGVGDGRYGEGSVRQLCGQWKNRVSLRFREPRRDIPWGAPFL